MVICYTSIEIMLKLQYFGHLMQRVNSLEKTLMLGKIGGRRRRGRQRMRWLLHWGSYHRAHYLAGDVNRETRNYGSARHK